MNFSAVLALLDEGLNALSWRNGMATYLNQRDKVLVYIAEYILNFQKEDYNNI